ncbi:MAG: hypothetical protein DSY81_07955 [Bacillota bacterium]|nr:MAG: hypothetical protein DSY92_09690 [Planctomycetota bacterium]RUA09031.1 MAG: hypothetical protein DSY81_07955 [Bacillota bacterium]
MSGASNSKGFSASNRGLNKNGHDLDGKNLNGKDLNGHHLDGQRPGENHFAPGSYGPYCSLCPARSRCRRICDLVDNLIPSMERGRVDSEDLPRLFMGVRSVNVLLDNIKILTPRQQEVVRLYYRESLMQQEIAQRLKVTQQAVADSLVRARRAIGRHFGARDLAGSSGQQSSPGQ